MSIEKKKTAKGQPRYEVRYRGLDGREHSRTFTTRADAVAYERQQRVDLGRGVWTDPSAGKVSLRQWSDEWLTTIVDRAGSTRRIHAGNLRLHVLPDVIDGDGGVLSPGLGDYQLAKLTTRQLTTWLAALAVKPKCRGEGYLAPAMVNQIYRTLNQCLNAAVLCGQIGRNPLDRVKAPMSDRPPLRILDGDEVERLAATIQPEYRLVVLLGAYCGLRIGEILALRWENIDLATRRLTVVAQLDAYGAHPGAVKVPKTKAGRRSLTVPPFIANALAEHRHHWRNGRALSLVGAEGKGQGAPRPSDFVFTAPEGGPVQIDNFRRRVWTPAVKRAGLHPLRIHDLRHTCASLAIGAGGDVKVLQRMLGHASASLTLDTYGHLFPGQAEAVADRLDALHGARYGAVVEAS